MPGAGLVRALPEGRIGQLLAVGLAVAVLTLAWLGVVAPVLGWYQARQDQAAMAREEAVHMEMLRRSLPDLRREVAASTTQAGPQILLAGQSDAIAGANLQSMLQNLAGQAGISLDSATVLPAQPVGALRRIGIEVSVTTTWPALIALLTAIDTAQPKMIVDDLALTEPASPDPGQDVPLQADFSVAAFHAGAGP